MFVKIVTILVVLVALVWMLTPARRRVGRAPDPQRGTPPPRVPKAHDLEKCVRCGVWLPAGDPCGCKARA